MRGRNASQLCRNVATLHQFQLKMHSYEPACCRASQQTTSRRRNAHARPTKRREQQRHHRVSTFSASAGPIVSGGIRAATPSSTLYIIAHHATLTENDGDADWSNILRVSLSSSASNDLGSHLRSLPRGVCVCACSRAAHNDGKVWGLAFVGSPVCVLNQLCFAVFRFRSFSSL